MKKIVVAGIGIISLLYLLNLGAGFIEFIPDNFPLIGNLDEVTATVLLVSSLKYFGVDIRSLFAEKDEGKDKNKNSSKQFQQSE